MSYWRDLARSVILAALEDGRARGLDGKALVRHVDSAYPFGPRDHHPYQMWLSERRALLGDLLPRHGRRPEPGSPAPDLPLFPTRENPQ